MNIRMLLRGEWFKASRRLAFVAVTVLVAGVAAVMNAGAWYEGRHSDKPFAFPSAWATILGQPAQMSSLFCVVLVIMLIASEFQWRTARQNVIDGLSKDEWFVSKMMLTVGLCLFYILVLIAVGIPFAAVSKFETFVQAGDFKIVFGATVGMIGFTSIAFMLALIVRSAGAALGVFLLILSMVESVVMLLVLKFHKAWLPKTGFLPIRLFGRMLEPHQWDPALVARAAEASRHAGNDLPAQPGMTLITAVGLAYIVAFFGIAYWNYSKRDL